MAGEVVLSGESGDVTYVSQDLGGEYGPKPW